MIKIYLEFCSVIYHFYVRKKDNMPAMYTFWASSLLLFANIFAIYGILDMYFIANLPSATELVYYIGGIICLVNYFGVIKPARYKSITLHKDSGFYSILYIIFSIILVILIANKHRDIVLKEKENYKTEIIQH